MAVDKDVFHEACEIARKQVPLSTYLVKNKLTYEQEESRGMIRCPFPDHNDGNPSFSYDDEKNVFHCFGCGRSGDVVNLHYYMNSIEDERFSRIRALKELSKDFSFQIPNLEKKEMKLGKVNKYKRATIEKGKFKEEFYQEKVRGLEPKLKLVSPKKRLQAYRKIDDMLLGRITARDAFLEVKKALK